MKTLLKKNTSYEGESIEQKIARIIESGEPIDAAAPIIYTDRKDGVLPEYDIRTDRWEIAQDAVNRINAMNIAKSTGMPDTNPNPNPTPSNEPQNS